MASSEPESLFNVIYRAFFWLYLLISLLQWMAHGLALPDPNFTQALIGSAFYVGQIVYMATSQPCHWFNTIYHRFFWPFTVIVLAILFIPCNDF